MLVQLRYVENAGGLRLNKRRLQVMRGARAGTLQYYTYSAATICSSWGGRSPVPNGIVRRRRPLQCLSGMKQFGRLACRPKYL